MLLVDSQKMMFMRVCRISVIYKMCIRDSDAGLDHGPFFELGDDKLTKISRFMFYPYYMPNVVGLSRVAVTNHSFGTAYRGYGAPQAFTASEALVDMLAEKAGIDPFEIRYKNIARPGQDNINQYPVSYTHLISRFAPSISLAVTIFTTPGIFSASLQSMLMIFA